MSRLTSANRLEASDPFARYLPLQRSHDDVAADLASYAPKACLAASCGEGDHSEPRDASPHARRSSKRFTVTLCVEQCWSTVLEADDPDTAQDKALDLWDEQAPLGFKEADILRVDAIDATELP